MEKISYSQVESYCNELHAIAANIKSKLEEIEGIRTSLTSGVWEGKASDAYKNELGEQTLQFEPMYKEVENSILFMAACSDGYEAMDRNLLNEVCGNLGIESDRAGLYTSKIFSLNNYYVERSGEYSLDGIYVSEEHYSKLTDAYGYRQGVNNSSQCPAIAGTNMYHFGIFKENGVAYHNGNGLASTVNSRQDEILNDNWEVSSYHKFENTQSWDEFKEQMEGVNGGFVLSFNASHQYGHTCAGYQQDGVIYIIDNAGGSRDSGYVQAGNGVNMSVQTLDEFVENNSYLNTYTLIDMVVLTESGD